jgi:hypothetical protein
VTSVLTYEFCSVFMEKISNFHSSVSSPFYFVFSELIFGLKLTVFLLYSPARFSSPFSSSVLSSVPVCLVSVAPGPQFGFHLVSLFLRREDLSFTRSSLEFIFIAVSRAVVDSRPPGSVFTAGFHAPVSCLWCSHLWVQSRNSSSPVCVSCSRLGFSSPDRFSHCFGLSSWFPRLDSLRSVFVSAVAGVEHQGPRS